MGNVRVHEDQGAAELNAAKVVGRVQSIGPVTMVMQNLGDHNVVFSFFNERTGASILSDRDTAVADEDTTYDGDGSTLVFSGASLGNTPALPGTVRIVDSGAVAPDLIDRDKDGNLYTDDVDEDFAGTVDYFTGALELSYPTGKAPGTGTDAIEANYSYQDVVLGKRGRRNYAIANVLQEETVVAYAACDDGEGSPIRTSGVATWL